MTTDEDPRYTREEPGEELNQDPAVTFLTQPGGFGGAYNDFVLYGVFNGTFAHGPTDPSANIDAYGGAGSNFLPNWRFVQASNSNITLSHVRDTASPSGSNVRFTFDNTGAANDEAYIEQIVAIGGDRRRANAFVASVLFYRVTASGGAPLGTLESQFLTVSGTTTGVTTTDTAPLSANATAYYQWNHITISPPADAYYLRLRVGVRRNTMANSDTATIDVPNLRIDRGGRFGVVPDQSGNPSYGPAYIWQTSGSLYLIPAYYSHGGTYAQIDAGTGNFNIFAVNDIYLVGDRTLTPEVAAPGSTPSGYYAIYAKTDGILYGKNDAGTEIALGGGGTITGPLILTNIIGLLSIGANQNDYAPAGLATCAHMMIECTGAARTITGFDATGFVEGQEFTIHVSAAGSVYDLNLAHASASSTSGNRIANATAATLTVRQQGSVRIVYLPSISATAPFRVVGA